MKASREVLLQAANDSVGQAEVDLTMCDTSDIGMERLWNAVDAVRFAVSKLIELERLRDGEGGEE